MYSMVLMMAMTGQAAEMPAWGRKGCCGGAVGFGAHGAGSCLGSSAHNYWTGWGYGPLTYYGFAGCYGSCYGTYTNYFSYWSQPINTHYGYGMPMRAGPGAPPVAPPPTPPKGERKSVALAPATVIVSLPAGAALFANGVRTSQFAAERRFVTPDLEPGETYHYEFTVEAQIDGRIVKGSRLVEVQAGMTSRLDFSDLAAAKLTTAGEELAIGGK
jgi:uncharacterized protein (TIGR03000 family)